MIKKNYKGRCIKKSVSKSKEVCRTYNELQLAYLDSLQSNDDITEIQCNIPLDGKEIGEYNTDFLCTKSNGDLLVRECVFRKHLLTPRFSQYDRKTFGCFTLILAETWC